MSATQTQTVTNGEHKPSQFLNHLKSYPVVSDGIDTFKANPLGAKSLEIADATYNAIGKPLEPHLRTPYSYAAPYVGKADSVADSTLKSIDSHFPIVKEDTNTIVGTVKSYVFWPFKVAGDGKEYLTGAWSDEYNKSVSNRGGLGPISLGMAGFNFGLRVTSDSLHSAAEWIGPKKEEAKQKSSDLLSQAKQKKDSYAQKVQKET